jgi:hypothetical protein
VQNYVCPDPKRKSEWDSIVEVYFES